VKSLVEAKNVKSLVEATEKAITFIKKFDHDIPY